MMYRTKTVLGVSLVAVTLTSAVAICFLADEYHRTVTSRVSSAKVELERYHHKFGTVLPRHELSTQFVIRNVGDHDLTLGEIKTSCGCTAGRASKNVLPPNSTASVEILFTPPDAMPVTHSAIIPTNDPTAPYVKLTVSADPKWPIEVHPGKLSYSKLLRGQTIERQIEVFSPNVRAFTIKQVEPSSSCIKVDLIRHDVRRHVFRVSITPNKIGRFEEMIRVDTDVKDRPTIVVPIVAHVIGKARIRPARILLGERQPAVRTTVLLTLGTDTSIASVQTVRVAATNWDVAMFNIVASDSEAFKISIEVIVPSELGYHRSALILKSETSEVSVPISCYVNSSP